MSADLRAALETLREDWSLEEIVKEAIRGAEWCCEIGCGSGACESCPCCCAGFCVSGRDGLSEDPEEVGRWLEIAAEHNPAIAALRPLLFREPPALMRVKDAIRSGLGNGTRGACACESHICSAADAVLALVGGDAK